MALQFYLVPNHISTNDGDYKAVSVTRESYSIEEVYDHMTREGSTVTKAEALAGFEEITAGIIKLLEQGHSVVTPLVNIKPGISGVFENEEDSFDPDRHRVNINMSAGKRLRGMAENINIEKIAPRKRTPAPAHYYDNVTGKKNRMITPGKGARITGELLKFDQEDENQGVFFVDKDNGTETKVQRNMLKNKPQELIFTNPDLPAGTYRLEIRSQVFNTSEIRTGSLPAELRVEES